MKIKRKLQLGIGLLFMLNLIVGLLGVLYLNQLAKDANSVLRANYESLQYIRGLSDLLQQENDRPEADRYKQIEQFLILQEKNVTEPGEAAVTAQLRNDFQLLKAAKDSPQEQLRKLETHKKLSSLNKMNLDAIYAKNIKTQQTAKRVIIYLSFITSFCLLIGFSFMVNFPSYIARPLRELTAGIKAISEKRYNQRLEIRSGDEFGVLAEAFNTMARKLNEYESSNWADVLFEKKRIETIIDQMKDPIIGLDNSNCILFINETCLKLLGEESQVLVGRYAPDIALHNDLFRTIIAGGEKKEITLSAPPGEHVFLKDLVEVNYSNEVIGKVIVLKNITAFHELDAAKTNFIATISHELKTPISSIRLSLKLLEDIRVGETNREQRALLKNISEDTTRLLKITSELLDLSQVETGNINLSIKETNPMDIVEYAKNTVQIQGHEKQILIRVNQERGLPLISADEEKTAWVLVNFLSNAIRYSPVNSTVVVKVTRLERSVEFSVQDNGPGIEDQYKERVFERYFQIPSNEKDKTGTGLGLAISKDFIEAQKGEIFIRSKPGEGSTFGFRLPFSRPGA